MPELPPPKRRPADPPPARPAPVAYAELFAKTNFSFLEGASHPDEMVERAAELGYRAIAVADTQTLAGVVRAHTAAKAAGVKLIIGAEIRPVDAPACVLLATDRAAYGRLSRLLTVGRRRSPKGECRIELTDIADHAEGLLALVLPAEDSSPASVAVYRNIFPEAHLAVSLHCGPDDDARLTRLLDLSRLARLTPVAVGSAHYHEPARRPLQDVLTCVREGCTLADAGHRLFANGDRHLHATDEIAARFARCPELLARTVELADRCMFRLDELRYEYPRELCPQGETPMSHLTRLTWQGAAQHYPAGVPDKVRRLIEHELRLIEELRYEPYFLTVWDIVCFARSRGILCQGRGSAANSAVCFCLGITSVDPDRLDTLFERFVSRERNEPPDIDVDFEHERREEVFQYIYAKYGRERAGVVAEVISYRTRSAVRDVGKTLGLSQDRVDLLSKTLDPRGGADDLEARLAEAGVDPADRTVGLLAALVREVADFPRHLSQHVGGFVITQGRLDELVPIHNGGMPDRTFIEWDKDDIDALGILKVDCLALGMLTCIRKCFDLVRPVEGAGPLTLANVPAEDPAVYDMICRADTVGVFQIESRAQMSMLPRLLPRCFYDLVIEVAIVRPGPIQGGMVHPYLRRRRGQEAITFPNEAVRSVLEKTLGVPLFQEQAMRLAMVAAGFTPGEADQLRRAMGAWRKRGVIEQFRVKLRQGMLANGLPVDFADRVFEQIKGFGEYGFPESHAASFARLVYISAWLKHKHPGAFAIALLNSQPMGFYAPAQIVRDAMEHGVTVRAIDVNASDWDCTSEADLEPALSGGSLAPLGTEPALPELFRRSAIGNRQSAVGSRQSAIGNRQSAVGYEAFVSGATGGTPPVRTQSNPRPQSADPGPHSTDHWPLTTGHWPLSTRMRLGFRLIKGIRRPVIDRLLAARRERAFASLHDVVRRAGVRGEPLLRLAAADAFGSLGLTRRQALWLALAYRYEDDLPLFADLEPPPVRATLPEPPMMEQVLDDYALVGLSLRAHPIGLLRPELDRAGIVSSQAVAGSPDGRRVRTGGVVLLRQRPSTARGITFVTLEDEAGIVNLVVKPEVFERHRRIALSGAALVAEGQVQRDGIVVHVVVERLFDLSAELAGFSARSRDFR